MSTEQEMLRAEVPLWNYENQLEKKPESTKQALVNNQ